MTKNGRPSKKKQLRIAQILRPYFERGYTATFTAEKTRFNVKTVCKHFNRWAEQITQSQERDFFARDEVLRARITLSDENVLFELYELRDQIKKEIKKYQKENKFVPKHTWSAPVEVLKTILLLTEKKNKFCIEPTLDESVKMKIREKIKNVTKSHN